LANYANGHNQESFLDKEKMRELEDRLHSSFLKCYNCWLWFTMICCGMSLFQTFLAIVTLGGQMDGLLLVLGSSTGTLWAIVQSVYGVQAISQKSLSKAIVACWMMTISLICSIIIAVGLTVALFVWSPDTSDKNSDVWYFLMEYFLAITVVSSFVSILVNVNGAYKVKNILSEMNVLQEKIGRANDAIYP